MENISADQLTDKAFQLLVFRRGMFDRVVFKRSHQYPETITTEQHHSRV